MKLFKKSLVYINKNKNKKEKRKWKIWNFDRGIGLYDSKKR